MQSHYRFKVVLGVFMLLNLSYTVLKTQCAQGLKETNATANLNGNLTSQ